jgi:hypothetical protein
VLSVLLSVALKNWSVPPQEAAASWIPDLLGGIFTIVSSPRYIFCPDNPTCRKNNPWRMKVWQEQEKKQRKFFVATASENRICF